MVIKLRRRFINLQVDVYLLFIRIRDGIKSLEITISESVD